MGLQHGIAIPHGTTAHVSQEVAALGIFPDGVPFESVDGSVTQIVILLITPQDLRHRHVTNLAHLARQLLQPGLRGALLEAKSQADVLAAIRSAG
ncbi:MAG: PTS sugar transporter subunit IIA [Verrucomicrobiota bacterium]